MTLYSDMAALLAAVLLRLCCVIPGGKLAGLVAEVLQNEIWA